MNSQKKTSKFSTYEAFYNFKNYLEVHNEKKLNMIFQ